MIFIKLAFPKLISENRTFTIFIAQVFTVFTGCYSNFITWKGPKNALMDKSNPQGPDLSQVFKAFFEPWLSLCFFSWKDTNPGLNWDLEDRLDWTCWTPLVIASLFLSLSKANARRWTWRTQQSWAQSLAKEWCNFSVLTSPLKRQSVISGKEIYERMTDTESEPVSAVAQAQS